MVHFRTWQCNGCLLRVTAVADLHRLPQRPQLHWKTSCSSSHSWPLSDAPWPYPPFDFIWTWKDSTDENPKLMSPDPTCVVWIKLVGSPIIERSIRRRLFGWGCSAMQQLKQTQNSVMSTKQRQLPHSVFLLASVVTPQIHTSSLLQTNEQYKWNCLKYTRYPYVNE